MSQYDEDDSAIDGIDEDAAARRVRMQLWRRLFAYTKPYRGTVAILAGAAVFTAGMDVAFPLLNRAVIDEASEHGLSAALMRWGYLYALGILLFACAIGTFIWAGGRIRTHVSHDIRRDGFANLQQLSFGFYDYRPVGWLMARMTSDIERLANILAWGVLDLVWGFTVMAGIAIAMLVMDWRLALIVLAAIPVLGWISALFQKRILKSAREVRRANSRITASYNEGIMGVLTTKSFVREQHNAQDFAGLTDTMHGASVRNQVQAAVYVPLVLTIASLTLGLTLAAGGMELAAGIITTGTLIAFLTYARIFFEPIEQLGRWFAELQMAQASAERILSLIDARADIRDDDAVLAALAKWRDAGARADIPSVGAAAAVAADGGRARIDRIELRDVWFHYDPAQPVLRGIDLDVHAGETIAIVGPTGGGKSTLVNLVCRFYEPTSGQVLMDGVDYRQRSLHWLQSNLGIVLQGAHAFSGSIRENIRYGDLAADDAAVEAAARLAGADDFIRALPGGYDYEVGEGGARLSAGQKQLVSFARAVLANPQILVMDEATSSVDTETEQRIQRGLANLLRGRIAFVIAHRLSTIRNASRILVIEGGRITEQGTHAQLMALRGHYFALYRQQRLQESTQALEPAPQHAGT
jgi:ATP-binding cassette subfamily B protein